ncbi:uncharacterized protein LOC109792804 isoform X2 [Cajanus cajan]|uniref:uncharacterized protein LOC109792804 isoform X2 n=1 Tax=Cajanus cajan TaxID=3821 RepID=UPI0010FBBA97|nr:uncharacterized protein LOC109792804 isoform X2 [Cajanus cajan]
MSHVPPLRYIFWCQLYGLLVGLLIIMNEYERRLSERESQQLSGDHAASSVQYENSIFYDVVSGVNNKGRIFGLGSEAGKYEPSSSTFLDGISNLEYEQMKNLVSNLSEENKTLKEQLQSHADLIRASQEESRLVREQLKQFMEMFSQSSHPPQPTPTHDVDTIQSDDNELDDDHDRCLGMHNLLLLLISTMF